MRQGIKKLGTRSAVTGLISATALLLSQGLAFGDTTGWDLTSSGSTVSPGVHLQLYPQWPCSGTCTYDQSSVFRFGSLNDASLDTGSAAPNLVNKRTGAKVGACTWNSSKLICSPTSSGSTGDALALSSSVAGTASRSSCTHSFYLDWWDSRGTPSEPNPNDEWDSSSFALVTTFGNCG